MCTHIFMDIEYVLFLYFSVGHACTYTHLRVFVTTAAQHLRCAGGKVSIWQTDSDNEVCSVLPVWPTELGHKQHRTIISPVNGDNRLYDCNQE